MKKPLIALVLLVVLALGAWAWMHQRNQGHDDALVLHGNVDIRQIALAFDGSGRVAELRVEEGDRVNAGVVLGVLDTRTLALQAEQAQAQIGVQQQTLRRRRNWPCCSTRSLKANSRRRQTPWCVRACSNPATWRHRRNLCWPWR